MTRFAVSIPQTFLDGVVKPAEIRRFLDRAESLGCFEGVWDQEQILGTIPALEPVDLLTYSAACTEKLRLGCAVLITAIRSPVHLAKSLSTIDQLSQGRLDVGVGLGAATRIYPAFGVDPGTRVARFVEGIRIMKALWTEQRVDLEGRFWQLKNAAMEPKPFQKPHPPLWFGGNHPNALRRAVLLGTGFIGAGSSSNVDFAEQMRLVKGFLAEAQRDPSTFDFGKRVYIAVDENKDRAWGKLAQWFGARYGRTNYEHIAIWGPANECAQRVREVIDAGARLVLFTPVYDEYEQMERIAGEVIPQLST
jgi:probable F420-dependent oxidoreductase